MTPVNHDFDDILRRALHAAADSLEPASDGLERISRRMSKPWLVRQMWLIRNDCADLYRLIVIRLEPRFSKALSSLMPAVAAVRALIAPSWRPGAAHRGQPARGWASLRPTLAWLRPALAVATAVVVVVAGVYGLAQLRETLVLSLFPSSAAPSTAPSTPGGGHQNSAHPARSLPGGPAPSGASSASHRATPKATCSRTSAKKPTPGPSASATPTPTGSASSTPTPIPTDTLNPSSTPSALRSPLVASAARMTGKTASGARNVAAASTHCTRSSPKASAHPTASARPT